MLTPVTGFKFFVDYALNGNADGGSEMKSYLRDGTYVNAGGNGIFGAAFDWNIAQSFDLGFNLGSPLLSVMLLELMQRTGRLMVQM